MIDVLDKLQAVDGYVRLILKSGEIVFGKPDCIVYDEDEDGYDTIKTIRFEPIGNEYAKYYKEEDIQEFNECELETYKWIMKNHSKI